MMAGPGGSKAEGHALLAARIVAIDSARYILSRSTGKDLPLPWMTALDEMAISHVVERLDPRTCLEWGAGFGTIHFANRARHLGRWVSVEHDEAWARRIRARLRGGAIELVHVPPSRPDWRLDGREGDLRAFKDYVEYPDRLGQRFDLVLIDGKARLDCLRQARGLVSKEGLVVLHDAHRYDYRGTLSTLGPAIELVDPRNGFCILVAGVSRDPRSVLDVAYLEGVYSAVGALHARLARSLGRAYLACTFRGGPGKA